MIDCKHATELLSQKMDRKLSLRERMRLRLHLLVCVGCRNTAGHFRFIRAAISRHPWKL